MTAARDLGGEAQRDPFLRLDVQHQLVGHQVLDRSVAEQNEWRASELNDNTRVARRQALAGAQVEGNIRPAPVVDQQLHGDKGFGARVGRNVGFGSICRNALAVDHCPRRIARVRCESGPLPDVSGWIACRIFACSSRTASALERNRRLHRCEGDELHDVIRHHVSQRARRVVVAASLFDAHSFRDRNLDVVDVTPVPDGLEDPIGETERQDVLDSLFAQIMIDAINLLFVERL